MTCNFCTNLILQKFSQLTFCMVENSFKKLCHFVLSTYLLVKILDVRKHSSRMRTARLPSTYVVAAATRCQVPGVKVGIPGRCNGVGIHKHP